MIKFLIKEKKLPNLVSLDNKDTFNAKVKLTIKFTKPISKTQTRQYIKRVTDISKCIDVYPKYALENATCEISSGRFNKYPIKGVIPKRIPKKKFPNIEP